mgnify:CR=1 FL=1
MAANETVNAPIAGAVLELGATADACKIYGSWGIRRVYPYESESYPSWVVELEQPAAFQVNEDGGERCNYVGMVCPFAGFETLTHPLSAGFVPNDVPAPDELHGQLVILYNDTEGAPPGLVVNVLVFRVPGMEFGPVQTA